MNTIFIKIISINKKYIPKIISFFISLIVGFFLFPIIKVIVSVVYLFFYILLVTDNSQNLDKIGINPILSLILVILSVVLTFISMFKLNKIQTTMIIFILIRVLIIIFGFLSGLLIAQVNHNFLLL